MASRTPAESRRSAASRRAPRQLASSPRTVTPSTTSSQAPGHAIRASAPLAAPGAIAAVGVVLAALGQLVPGIALVVVAIVLALASARLGDPARLVASIPARPADPSGDARAVNVLDGLCVAFGLPAPQLRVLDDSAPNLVTLGRHPNDAVMVCTTGLLDTLGRIELEAVLAHELAHVKRGDTAVAARATRALGLVALFWRGAGRAVLALGDASREERADASGVAVTRYPPGLHDALSKLQQATTTRPAGLSAQVARLTAASWCVPLAEAMPRRTRPGVLDLELRIAALAER